MLIVIGERNEYIVGVQRGLSDATDGPLTRTLETTSSALPAWKFDGLVYETLMPAEDDSTLAGIRVSRFRPEPFEGFKTGHG